ncbi:TetR/AcrR family transcriptional regulator C-terminal domain-containing protein [Streptomyces sp. NPDC004629]|uniref:TetR/AcrR family transcriptional regulator C-terminal domain-containing protein n=1 Tax=Streptomyces sp. NPDC004629 TaxID=3364705 RepID=UPI00369F4C92
MFAHAPRGAVRRQQVQERSGRERLRAEDTRPRPCTGGEEFERDHGVDRRLPHHGLAPVLRHGPLVVDHVVQIHLARGAVLGAAHPGTRAGLAVQALAAAYVAHPQAALLTANRVTGRAHELAADEAVLDILRTAGFPVADTVRVYQAFIDQTLAFAALDAASLALPSDFQRADEATWSSLYARLPATTHPRIAEAAPLLATRMLTSACPVALDMLLDSAAHHLSVLPEADRDASALRWMCRAALLVTGF